MPCTCLLWCKVREVSDRTLNDKRFELRTAEETLAAIEVATAHAIRMLGFDETIYAYCSAKVHEAEGPYWGDNNALASRCAAR